MAHSKFSYMDLADCLSSVSKLIDTLNTFADELDEHKFNANVSKAVGGAAATVGSGIAIAGAVASFFTFGISSALIPVGIAVGAVGGGTVAGSAIVELVIKKSKLKEAEILWKETMDLPVLKRYIKTIDELQAELKTLDIATGVFRTAKTGVQIGGIIAKTMGKTGVETAKVAARALVVAGAAMEVALLPLSLYDLINSSIEAHKRNKCPAGQELREVAKTFEKVRDNLREQLNRPALDFNPKPVKP